MMYQKPFGRGLSVLTTAAALALTVSAQADCVDTYPWSNPVAISAPTGSTFGTSSEADYGAPGSWVVAWEVSHPLYTGSTVQTPDVAIVRSSTDGQTWVSPYLLNPRPEATYLPGYETAYAPSIASNHASSANTVLAYNYIKDDATNVDAVDTTGVRVRTSPGLWSPGTFSTGITIQYAFNPVVRYADGQFMLAYLVDAEGTANDGLLFQTSTDGATWTTAVAVDNTAPFIDPAGDWNLTLNEANATLVLLASSATAVQTFAYTSTDGGATWSRTEVLDTSAASLGGVLANNLVVDQLGNWTGQLVSGGSVYDIVSTDDGVSWVANNQTLAAVAVGIDADFPASTGLIRGYNTSYQNKDVGDVAWDAAGTYPAAVAGSGALNVRTNQLGSWITNFSTGAGQGYISYMRLQANLGLTKTVVTADPFVGQPLEYLVTLTNTGEINAPGTVLTDTLPANSTFVSATDGNGTCVQNSGVVTCNIGALACGDTTTVQVIVTPNDSGSFTNTVSAVSQRQDFTPAAAAVAAAVTGTAEVAIIKSAAPEPVIAGDPLTYTITVINNGPNSANDVVVTDTLPLGVTFVSATGGTCTESGGQVECAVGAIANGDNRVVSIVVTPNSVGTIVNNAGVRTVDIDPNLENNETSVTTTVNPSLADLAITKIDTPDPVVTGAELTYSITVVNNGPRTARETIVTDTLPAGVTFVSATGGTCSLTGSDLVCSLGNVAIGESRVVTIVVTAPQPGTITNVATVDALDDDPDTANNTATATTTVAPAVADLSITKTATPATVNSGASVTFNIVVSNAGPQRAGGVVVTDELPAGLSYTGSTASQGACNASGQLVTCNLGSIDVNASVQVAITVQTSSAGTYVNTAAVKGVQGDSNEANNTASTTITVNQAQGGPDLIGKWLYVKTRCQQLFTGPKCGVVAGFCVENRGFVPRTPKGITVNVFISDDAKLDPSDPLLQTRRAKKGIPNGRIIGFKMIKRFNYSLTGKYLIGVVDTTNVAAEGDETNNVYVYGPLP